MLILSLIGAAAGLAFGIVVAALVALGLRRLFPRLDKAWIVIAAAIATPCIAQIAAFMILEFFAVPSEGTDGPQVFVILVILSLPPTAMAFAASIPTAFVTLRRLDRR